MNNLTTIKCSVFQSVDNPIPERMAYLFDMVTTEYFKYKVLEYRYYGCSELKRELPAFTPSGVFSRRNARSLLEPSNIICIDIDGNDNPSISSAQEMKRIVSQFPFVWYCGDSVGGKGVFCLIKYDDHIKHKEYFRALQQDFFSVGLNIDKSCSDICRLRIVSYDPEPYINLNAEIYNRTTSDNIPTTISFQPKNENIIVEPKISSIEAALLQPSNLDSVNLFPERYGYRYSILELFQRVIAEKIDITSYYHDWFRIGCVIKDIHGESGRVLFHEISQFYPHYSEEECDKKYDSIIKGNYHYRFDIINEIAARYGIYINTHR